MRRIRSAKHEVVIEPAQRFGKGSVPSGLWLHPRKKREQNALAPSTKTVGRMMTKKHADPTIAMPGRAGGKFTVWDTRQGNWRCKRAQQSALCRASVSTAYHRRQNTQRAAAVQLRQGNSGMYLGIRSSPPNWDHTAAGRRRGSGKGSATALMGKPVGLGSRFDGRAGAGAARGLSCLLLE